MHDYVICFVTFRFVSCFLVLFVQIAFDLDRLVGGSFRNRRGWKPVNPELRKKRVSPSD